MTQLKFEQHTFNTISLTLKAQGETVELRPKTAELLRELITRRECVLSKRDLIKWVWRTEHVTDQSLFQAMSELRAKLAPGSIKTFPNRGYQWVVPVVELTVEPMLKVKQHRLRVTAAAAVLIATIGFASQWTTLLPSKQVIQPTSLSAKTADHPVASLPALVAFSEGVSALQRGDTALALELLELSVVERPDFTEARLLLAEANLLHGNALRSRELADNVMNALDSSANAYSLIAAMDLISRADQQLGKMSSALEWATRAADRAKTNGFECTAADLHDRVLALVHDHDYSKFLEASPVFASESAQELLNAAFASLTTDANFAERRLVHSPLESDGNQAAKDLGWLGDAVKPTRPAHCERLRGGPTSELRWVSELDSA